MTRVHPRLRLVERTRLLFPVRGRSHLRDGDSDGDGVGGGDRDEGKERKMMGGDLVVGSIHPFHY